MFDWKNYTQQHIPAVDMSAAIIFAHRAKNLPIKAIHLRPKLYGEFKKWVEKNVGRELTGEEKLEFDSVNIELGTGRQKSQLLVELWSEQPSFSKPKMGIA